MTARSGGRLRVEIDAPDGALRLPDRVEVAAYRIAVEAVTNVLRHAHATCCRIRIHVDDALRLEIRDNGRGLSDTTTPGIGLESMARRAADLGGTCAVIGPADGGTLVDASMPLPGPGIGVGVQRG